MSINLMSAIFRTEFRDLQDAEGNNTKASTAKFVCIALADHANDEGESAYPSIDKLAYKTNLSRTAIINALDALKHNGILSAHGESKLHTINYTINVNCFSRDSQPALLVNPLDSGGQPALPLPVNPVDPNHPLTVIETSKPLSIENAIATGREVTNDMLDNGESEKLHNFERCLGFGALPWGSNTIWTKFSKWVIAHSGFEADYARWREEEGKYKAFSNKKIRENPAAFIDTGYPEYEASKMYRKSEGMVELL